MNIPQDFKELLVLLEKHQVEYMVVGGYAVAFYGYPRFTRVIITIQFLAFHNHPWGFYHRNFLFTKYLKPFNTSLLQIHFYTIQTRKSIVNILPCFYHLDFHDCLSMCVSKATLPANKSSIPQTGQVKRVVHI